MKISYKGDYALKIILDLALNYGQGVTQIRDISKRQDIPERFLEQIITILKGAGYVKTMRGPKGGVYLAKEPAKITVGQIVRLIEGPTAPIACVSCSGHVACDFESKCVFKDMWADVRDRINEVVDTVTFQDLAKKANARKTAPLMDYSI